MRCHASDAGGLGLELTDASARARGRYRRPLLVGGGVLGGRGM